MRKALCLLLSACLPLHAYASGTLSFAARVDDESLAEEAILLVHCLSERSGRPWEFSGEARGDTWLLVTEKKPASLVATYRQGKQERTIALKTGGAAEACDELEPPSKSPSAPLSPASPSPRESSGSLPVFEEEMESGSSKKWLWIGLGSAALAGFFLWKSHRPDHRGIEMR